MSKEKKTTNAKLPERKRCAIYTRKSTTKGLDQEYNSLEAQYDACTAYIKSQAHLGWEVIDQRYDDGGFSGATIERPAFQRLLEDVDAGKINVVVVYKVDRFSRSLLDFASTMERFEERNAEFVSVTQNFSTASALGNLTMNILMAFAEFEREMTSERIRDKIGAARRRGKWTGGVVPYGYVVVERRLLVNDYEAMVVREIFDLYLKNRSAQTVMQLLNERGRKTKQGKSWDKDDVLRVLKNPISIGITTLGEERHQGEHQAIIEASTFARVQALLKQNDCRNGNSYGRNDAYVLRGVLRCTCGGAMTSASTRKSDREYRYYRCSNRDKKGIESCAARQLPAEPLEKFVVEVLGDSTASGKLAAELTASLRERVKAERALLSEEQRCLRSELAKLRDVEDHLLEDLATALEKEKEKLNARLVEITERVGRQQYRLGEVEHRLAMLDDAEVEASWVERALREFTGLWEVMTPANRARLLKAVIEKVTVDPSGDVTVLLAAGEKPTGEKRRGKRPELSGSSAEATR